MQQTETYKLNLIETSDPFSPQALNENTQKIEEVVHEKLREMDERIKVFEAKKLVAGVYQSTSQKNQFIDLGFTPDAVFATDAISPNQCFFVTRHEKTTNGYLKIVENGFLLPIVDGFSPNNGRPFCFLALVQ